MGDQRDPMATIGVHAVISDRVLQQAKADEVLRRLKRLQISSLVDLLLVEGLEPITVVTAFERAVEFAAVEVAQTVETVPAEDLASLLVQSRLRVDRLFMAIEAINEISWWRLVWGKLRGRALVVFKP